MTEMEDRDREDVDEKRPLLMKVTEKFEGFCYMFGVVVMHITADSLSKLLLETTQVFLIIMTRGLAMILVTIPVMYLKSISLKDSLPEWKLLTLRGLTSTFSVLTRVAALYFSPLGDVTAVIAVTPILTSFWSGIILDEASSIFEIGFAILSAVGICMIAQPQDLMTISSDHHLYYGIGLAVLSTVFASLGIVLSRKLSQRDIIISPFVQVFYYGVILTVLNFTALVVSIPVSKSLSLPSWRELMLLVVTGLTHVLKQTFLTIVLKRDKAVLVSAFTYTMSIVLAYLTQLMFFKDVPTLLSLLGTFLCLLATIGFVLTKVYL